MSDDLLKRQSETETSVVYGVYDSSSQPFSVRMHDFFVDCRGVSVQDKSYFYHLLAVMVDAGIPIMKALKVLSKKVLMKDFHELLTHLLLMLSVEKIERIDDKISEIFKESEVGVVKSGETIGSLGDLLFKLAYQTERSHNLLMKVRGALVYPITVLLALMVSGAIVITTVIPKLREFFVNLNSDLPPLTYFVLNFGNFVYSFFG